MSIPDYIPLDLQRLTTDVPLDCDLYVKRGHRYLLYRASSSPVSFKITDARRLVSSGVERLWIKFSEDDGAAQGRLASLLRLPDEQLPPRVKAQLWYGSAIATAKRAIKTNAPNSMLNDVQGLIGLTVDYLVRSESALSAILSSTVQDYSTHSHAVNVAVYSLGIGSFNDAAGEQDLRNLGLAAFLHDVGKAKIPRQVLLKPGPLSPDEWKLMRQHPGFGQEMLSSAPDLPAEVTEAVWQHHERLDGSGYPKGIGGSEMHHFAKVVSLADSFDAMTSSRPYARPQSAFKALSILKRECGAKYDSDLFINLVLLMGNPQRPEGVQVPAMAPT
ncbi:MAG: HD domain-containing phosphohydrolase [Dehalococcoidia bacterium]|nr:HD domain-containing phosphohydrolase [Dehalococcoidia bacterium]